MRVGAKKAREAYSKNKSSTKTVIIKLRFKKDESDRAKGRGGEEAWLGVRHWAISSRGKTREGECLIGAGGTGCCRKNSRSRREVIPQEARSRKKRGGMWWKGERSD